MAANPTAELREALNARTLVRFTTRFDDMAVGGYVVGVGPKFFLLAVINDRIWPDGFECFRIADVRGLGAHPRAAFIETALAARGHTGSAAPDIDLSSAGAILSSASRRFPLATVHCEIEDPDACWIGRVQSVEASKAWLLPMTTDAVWEDDPIDFDLKDVTHLGFGADYEAALYLVAGEPPDAAHSVH